MAPRHDVSEERKAQILDAATQVFVRSGFHEARMDDIAEQAGLSKGALYWYFDSKDAIIQGIMDRMFGREFEQLAAYIEVDVSAQEKLARFIELVVVDIKRMESLMPIMYEFWALLLRRKQVKEVLGSYYSGFFDLVRPIVRQGIDDGEFRKVDPEEVVVAMGAMIEGLFVLWAAVPEIVDLEKHIQSGMRLILDSIQKTD